MNKRLLFTVNHSKFFYSHRLPFALAAKERGYEVHVATSPTGIEDDIRSHGLHWHHLKLQPGGTNPVADLRTLFFMVDLYRRIDPDIIHHVTIKPVLYGSLAARWLGRSGVLNALSGLGYMFRGTDLRTRILRLPIRTLLKFALGYDRSIFLLQNPDDVKMVKQMNLVNEDKIELIRGSGADMEKFTPTEEPEADHPLIILPTRMLWEKGVGEFVEAARRINNREKRARFVLIGEPDRNNPNFVPEDQLKAWDEEGVVEWWGFCENMVDIIQNCHIVALPSYYGEGVPRVLIEAAACAKPIVTTDMPGCREIVEDGKNGYLVEAKNASDLADKIDQLLQNRESRIEMGKYGRALAEEHYSLQNTIDRTMKLYERLCDT